MDLSLDPTPPLFYINNMNYNRIKMNHINNKNKNKNKNKNDNNMNDNV